MCDAQVQVNIPTDREKPIKRDRKRERDIDTEKERKTGPYALKYN
jgi:hypothetical protein